MKYTVVGGCSIATKKGLVMPGHELSDVDLPDGVVLRALIEGGHLKKVVTHTRKKAAE